MDDLAIRLGIKLLVFCTLFVGISVGVKALRGRPAPKPDKGPPPGWYDLPKPDPGSTSPSGPVGAMVVSEAELARLCEERARRTEDRGETSSAVAYDRQSEEAEARTPQADTKPFGAREFGGGH